MFGFIKRKDALTKDEKDIIRMVCIFYEKNKHLFINAVRSQKEKIEIVKKIYKLLGYSKNPILTDTQDDFKNNDKLYVVINSENASLLHEYIDEFINGELFYSKIAPIYGVGIYTVIGNDSRVGYDYTTDGGTNKCGVVLESVLAKESKIIQYSKIQGIRNILFDNLRKMYSSEIENYLWLLQDDGLFASILGYDAIFIEDKNNMLVLNRSKMILNSSIINDIKSNNYRENDDEKII